VGSGRSEAAEPLTALDAALTIRASLSTKETPMSLVFYFAPQSTATITTLVLEELGTPCERVKLDFQKGDTKKPEFLKVNPNGRVPTLVHDGVAIWESAAITIYLGETFGDKAKLWPAPGPKRGEAMKWVVWTNVSLGEAVYRWARNTMWAPEDQRNAKAAAAASTDIASLLRVLDDALAGKQFLVGDYTLADTHVNSFVDWLRHMKIDTASLNHLNAWSKRCSERPAYARAMARENAAS
jgi:glutathione S-transferase